MAAQKVWWNGEVIRERSDRTVLLVALVILGCLLAPVILGQMSLGDLIGSVFSGVNIGTGPEL